jgi:hypothetical protein
MGKISRYEAKVAFIKSNKPHFKKATLEMMQYKKPHQTSNGILLVSKAYKAGLFSKTTVRTDVYNSLMRLCKKETIIKL